MKYTVAILNSDHNGLPDRGNPAWERDLEAESAPQAAEQGAILFVADADDLDRPWHLPVLVTSDAGSELFDVYEEVNVRVRPLR